VERCCEFIDHSLWVFIMDKNFARVLLILFMWIVEGKLISIGRDPERYHWAYRFEVLPKQRRNS
jgi:hypothetical protein